MFSYRCLPAIVNRSVTGVYHAFLNHFNGTETKPLYSSSVSKSIVTNVSIDKRRFDTSIR